MMVTMFELSERGNLNISCSSNGVPAPTISWTFNGQVAPFSQIDTVNETNLNIISAGVHEVTPGNIESTLLIMDAQYPTHHGIYDCTGTNSHNERNTTTSVNATVGISNVQLASIASPV